MAAETRPLRWLIGKELERHRKQAADRSGIGKYKINHLEIGRQTQAPADIAALLTAYSVQTHNIEPQRRAVPLCRWKASAAFIWPVLSSSDR